MVDHDPWLGETPYFLLISSLEPNEGGAFGHLVLDVDKPQWQVEYKDWLERSAEWYLCEKAGNMRAVLSQIVHRGEHPYFVKRHVGQATLNGNMHRSTIVYGIGKRVAATYDTSGKRRKQLTPERTDRLWLLPGNVVCGGEDVEMLAMNIVRALEWETQPPEEASAPE